MQLPVFEFSVVEKSQLLRLQALAELGRLTIEQVERQDAWYKLNQDSEAWADAKAEVIKKSFEIRAKAQALASL